MTLSRTLARTLAMDLKLRPGDLFLTRNPMALGRVITAIERWRARDDQAAYSHAGILLDGRGTTFESLWTVKSRHLFDAYAGRRILIARYSRMTRARFKEAFRKIENLRGAWYPFLRLPLMAIGLGKLIHWKPVVCSELVAKFLHNALKADGIFDFEHYHGWTPDDLHDVFRNWRTFQTVFEGELAIAGNQPCLSGKDQQ